MNENRYFLPYQIKWLNDRSPVKIWDKSRRIGATYVQAFEDVRDCVEGNVPAVWFSSADESAAREYILYCEQWANVFNVAAKAVEQEIIEEGKGVKAYVIEFKNGRRINALTSSPKRFRSKGGKVILDEFAWHDDDIQMWKAAKPCITWGFPMRILSTQNGKQKLFYRFIQAVAKAQLKWSLHTTTIFDAVKDGLIDKIKGRETSEQERAEWIEDQRRDCFDEATWKQEYCCEAVDEATAFLTYDLIYSIEREGLYLPLEEISGDLFVGVDIGRKKDLTVIWALERLGAVKYTRILKMLEKARFAVQREALFHVLQHSQLRRCCIDATGLGMQLAEEAQEEFGRFRVEPVNFSAALKEEMAYNLYTQAEDRTVLIPSEFAIREDLHSVRKIITGSGNIRFDVAAAENTSGHADRFWALALALHAAQEEFHAPANIVTRKRRETSRMLAGY